MSYQGEQISELQCGSRARFHIALVTRSLFLICPLKNMDMKDSPAGLCLDVN